MAVSAGREGRLKPRTQQEAGQGQAAQGALQALFDIRLPSHVPSRSRSHLLPQVRALGGCQGWSGAGAAGGLPAPSLCVGAPMPPRQQMLPLLP